MRGRILEQLDLVKGSPNDVSLPHHHCADPHFFGGVSFGRLTQGLTHKIMVALQIDYGAFAHIPHSHLAGWAPTLENNIARAKRCLELGMNILIPNPRPPQRCAAMTLPVSNRNAPPHYSGSGPRKSLHGTARTTAKYAPDQFAAALTPQSDCEEK